MSSLLVGSSRPYPRFRLQKPSVWQARHTFGLLCQQIRSIVMDAQVLLFGNDEVDSEIASFVVMVELVRVKESELVWACGLGA